MAKWLICVSELSDHRISTFVQGALAEDAVAGAVLGVEHFGAGLETEFAS